MSAPIPDYSASDILAKWFAAVGISYLVVSVIELWANVVYAASILRPSWIVLPAESLVLCLSFFFSTVQR